MSFNQFKPLSASARRSALLPARSRGLVRRRKASFVPAPRAANCHPGAAAPPEPRPVQDRPALSADPQQRRPPARRVETLGEGGGCLRATPRALQRAAHPRPPPLRAAARLPLPRSTPLGSLLPEAANPALALPRRRAERTEPLPPGHPREQAPRGRDRWLEQPAAPLAPLGLARRPAGTRQMLSPGAMVARSLYLQQARLHSASCELFRISRQARQLPAGRRAARRAHSPHYLCDLRSPGSASPCQRRCRHERKGAARETAEKGLRRSVQRLRG